MKVYEITKRNEAKNVFGISLVAEPAMESNYVKLSKEKTDTLTVEQKISLSKEYDIEFAEVNKEKRLLLGLVLEPNKLIYRYDQATKEEYYITVSADTILELQQQYIKDLNQSYSTLEHDGRELDGVTFTEHWIVEDSKVDKFALHGLNFKKGSWVAVAKIDNDTLWDDYIETGNVMGFSIDAMVQLEEINLNKDKQMSETKTILSALTDLKNQVALAFAPKEKEAKKYEDMTPEEKAEYDKKKKAKEEADKVAMAEAKKLDEADKVDDNLQLKAIQEMGVEFATIVKEAVEKALQPIQEANLELSKKVETLESKTVELKAELDEQPTSRAINTVPTQIDLSKASEWDKRKYYRQNNG